MNSKYKYWPGPEDWSVYLLGPELGPLPGRYKSLGGIIRLMTATILKRQLGPSKK